ncbi:MAG TPA: TonB-dependent receptor, partial [Bacteroides sp.]|nr:TonB-dependent receptor [Bacteroides sp.]
MLHRFFHIAVFIACVQVVSGQGIRDSVFRISQVEITAGPVFRKETAGMKETRVDSAVLAEKINLSLSDLLSENTTVFIKDHGRGALATASFRGTAASHTRVDWNGISINAPMTGMVDFSLIPVYLVDEVTLKHGNASIGGGSGGLGGAVHIGNT